MTFPNWFEPNEHIFNAYLSQFKDKPVTFLQIGAFAGHCSKFLLDNILTHPDSHLYDVDTWEGSWEHTDIDFKALEAEYDSTLDEHIKSGKLIKNKMTSDEFFKDNKIRFDFIYVDGDHRKAQVERDCLNSIKAIKLGGIIAFDDYTWNLNKADEEEIPFYALAAFIPRHKELRFDILTLSHQVWIKKN